MRRFSRPLFASTVVALAAIGTACSDNPTSREITAPNKALAGSLPDAPVISNLKVASGASYKVRPSALVSGATLYIDRTYTFKSVPSSVQGATYIQTANNDKAASPGSTTFLSFDVDRQVKVYVAHDDGVTRPSWLQNGWTKTSSYLVSSDNSKHFTLFSRTFDAGHVTLGSNIGSAGYGGSMYSVAIVSTGSSTVPADSDTTTTPSDPTAHSGWFVSPTGTSGASGAATSPWSLAFALGGANGKIQPGDTVWLRGG
ncbi:MAG TPA: hypothetical protein VF041_00785, partial [Gemmatimonadaceae bacterium]